VNGAHDTKKLCELLEAFIKKYVQCYDCGNPETVVKIKKECIYLKCKACGFVSGVDMRHKVNTFILRNPPENKMTKEEKKWVAQLGGEGGGGQRGGGELPSEPVAAAGGQAGKLCLTANIPYGPCAAAACMCWVVGAAACAGCLLAAMHACALCATPHLLLAACPAPAG
jgi:hypothetical protein